MHTQINIFRDVTFVISHIRRYSAHDGNTDAPVEKPHIDLGSVSKLYVRLKPGRAGPLHNFAGRAGPGPTYCGPGPGLG